MLISFAKISGNAVGLAKYIFSKCISGGLTVLVLVLIPVVAVVLLIIKCCDPLFLVSLMLLRVLIFKAIMII